MGRGFHRVTRSSAVEVLKRGVSPRFRRTNTTLDTRSKSLSGDEPCVKGNKFSSRGCEFHMHNNTTELCGVFGPAQRSCSIAQPRGLNSRRDLFLALFYYPPPQYVLTGTHLVCKRPNFKPQVRWCALLRVWEFPARGAVPCRSPSGH